MTRLISSNLPVVFQCLAVPVRWERATKDLSRLTTQNSLARYEMQQDGDLLSVRSLKNRAETFDPWQKRNEFFRLQRGDTEALLTFLHGVGFFERPRSASAVDAQECKGVINEEVYEAPFISRSSEKRIWEMRRLLEGSLKNLKDWTGKYSDFQARIVRTGARAQVVITTTTFLDALLLTLTVDCVQKAKIRKCARPDCGVSFSSTGGHKRKYCEWYCGHVESVRRSRRKRNQT